MVTAGQDGAVRFWDLRKKEIAIKTINAHAHWSGLVPALTRPRARA